MFSLARGCLRAVVRTKSSARDSGTAVHHALVPQRGGGRLFGLI